MSNLELIHNPHNETINRKGLSRAKLIALGLTAAAAVSLGLGSKPASAAEQAPGSVANDKVAAVADATPPPAPTPAPAEKQVGFVNANQPNEWYCGPAATRTALTTRGHMPSHEQLAKELNTTVNGTDSAKDTTRVLNAHIGGYQTKEVPGKSANPAAVNQVQTDVKNDVAGDKAIVANIQGTKTDLNGKEHSFEGGHYLTVVGYGDNGNTVKIADPYSHEGDGTYWMSTTEFADWVAEHGYSA